MSNSVRLHRRQPPGSPVPGILQARTLEWVAISFSHAWKWKVKVKSLSRVRLFETPWTAAHQAPPSMGFSRQQYWSGVPLPSPIVPLTRGISRLLSCWEYHMVKDLRALTVCHMGFYLPHLYSVLYPTLPPLCLLSPVQNLPASISSVNPLQVECVIMADCSEKQTGYFKLSRMMLKLIWKNKHSRKILKVLSNTQV